MLGGHIPQAVAELVARMVTLALLVIMVMITLSDAATGEAVLGVPPLQIIQAVPVEMVVCLVAVVEAEGLVQVPVGMVGAVMEQEAKSVCGRIR